MARKYKTFLEQVRTALMLLLFNAVAEHVKGMRLMTSRAHDQTWLSSSFVQHQIEAPGNITPT
jgi:hypothetical protein